MKKKVIISFLIIFMIFSNSHTAKADNVVGSSLYATVYGYQYRYYSTVTANSGTVWSHTYIRSNEGINLPAGYMGAYARLYNSNGTLVAASGWTYNSTSLGGISNMTPTYYTTSGTYYGKGQVRMYNGNGYANYNTTSSPYIQGRSLNPQYELNYNNEIYGSELILNQYNIYPDLIEAQGDNGKIGYVKSIDLNDPLPTTPDEAIEYQKNLPESRTILLYESDGTTVIDTFTIVYNIE